MNVISTSFMDGEVIDAKVDAYVKRFNNSMKQTAESILDMGNTITKHVRIWDLFRSHSFVKKSVWIRTIRCSRN